MRNVMITLLLCLVLVAPMEAQRVIPTPQSSTSGLTVFNVATGGTSATVNITTSAGQLYGLTVDAGENTPGEQVWVNFFNAVTGSVTPGTTAAYLSVPVQAGGTSNTATPMVVIPMGTPIGIPFSTALSFNCTTTRNGATATMAVCHAFGARK